jgi:hypothetical protein
MRFGFIVAICLCAITRLVGAETPHSEPEKGSSPFSVDFSASGLMPITWAQDSPTLPHFGLDAKLGLEFAATISLPIRLELGYIRVWHSRIAPTGELYRAWDGARFALLGGYSFASAKLGKLARLDLSILGGGALTAAEYTYTPLVYAYPSLVLEPRIVLRIGADALDGPWLALPIELMFRAGNHTLSPGLSLGWRHQIQEE